MLFCQNQFCIYWQNFACLLPDHAMDSRGSCIDCRLVEFDKDILEHKRLLELHKNSQAYLGGAIKKGQVID